MDPLGLGPERLGRNSNRQSSCALRPPTVAITHAYVVAPVVSGVEVVAQKPQRGDHGELPHLLANTGQPHQADLLEPRANHAHEKGPSGLSILFVRTGNPGERKPDVRAKPLSDTGSLSAGAGGGWLRDPPTFRPLGGARPPPSGSAPAPPPCTRRLIDSLRTA